MTSGTVAALAGEPVLKYFDLKAAGLGWAGRGGGVRFFLLAARAPFQEEVVHYDGDWANKKKAIIESGEHCMGQLPVVKLDGKILTESYAINRYLAKKLGLYGKDDDEDFMADAIADLVVTMRQDLVTATLGDDAAKATWKTEQRPRYYTAVEAAVSKFGGGANGHVVASSHLTFADPILAALLHDDAKTFSSDMLDEYPTLKAFYNAFVEMNPDVKAWIEDNAKP